MGWIYLMLAVVLEIAWASTLKWTDGYSRFGPSLVNLVLGIANMVILAKAIKLLPTALAYAIWTGLGTVGIAVLAWWFQGESFGPAKVLCMTLIVLGVIGLKTFSPT